MTLGNRGKARPYTYVWGLELVPPYWLTANTYAQNTHSSAPEPPNLKNTHFRGLRPRAPTLVQTLNLEVGRLVTEAPPTVGTPER